MPSQAKTKLTLAGGAVVVALAAGVGGGVLLSNTTTRGQTAGASRGVV